MGWLDGWLGLSYWLVVMVMLMMMMGRGGRVKRSIGPSSRFSELVRQGVLQGGCGDVRCMSQKLSVIDKQAP